MTKARPLAPANVNPWGRSIEQDVDRLLLDTDRLSTNVQAALQASGNAANATRLLGAGSALAQAQWSTDITVGAGWSGFADLPRVSVVSPTGRIEVNFGGSIRNGSGRICYSVTRDEDGVVLAERDVMRLDFARCIALTGGASFPASGYRVEIVSAGTSSVTVKAEVYGEAAGVVLSGVTIAVRPTI